MSDSAGSDAPGGLKRESFPLLMQLIKARAAEKSLVTAVLRQTDCGSFFPGSSSSDEDGDGGSPWGGCNSGCIAGTAGPAASAARTAAPVDGSLVPRCRCAPLAPRGGWSRLLASPTLLWPGAARDAAAAGGAPLDPAQAAFAQAAAPWGLRRVLGAVLQVYGGYCAVKILMVVATRLAQAAALWTPVRALVEL